MCRSNYWRRWFDTCIYLEAAVNGLWAGSAWFHDLMGWGNPWTHALGKGKGEKGKNSREMGIKTRQWQ